MGCGGRRNPFDFLGGCGGYRKPHYGSVKSDQVIKSPAQGSGSPVDIGPFSRELSQVSDAKENITKLREEVQSQIGFLQKRISAVDEEIQTILPVNQDLAHKLLETKFDLQEKISNYNTKLSRLEQEEADVDILVEEIQSKRLDYQASNTNARIKELKLRLTNSE
ncbi:MAG: hypothetical protein CVU89_14545 [Firmicutes bacterium HGW-Firmicutes-14]|nr:MAG: hypothetical protein CVU89_14545 [Firmicutes bacterium HGW-Firmicutes-14]